MRLHSGSALALGAALGLVATLLVPSSTGACHPCQPVELGERWELVLEAWSVDGATVPVTSSDAGFFIENPYRDRYPDGIALEAQLAHPSSPAATRSVSLSVDQVTP
jgi:hypothetical protein